MSNRIERGIRIAKLEFNKTTREVRKNVKKIAEKANKARKHFPEFWKYPERNQTEIQLQSEIEAHQDKITWLASQIRLQSEELQKIITPEILAVLTKEIMRGVDPSSEDLKLSCKLRGQLAKLDKRCIEIVLKSCLRRNKCEILQTKDESTLSVEKIQSLVRITNEALIARLEQELFPCEIDRQLLAEHQYDRNITEILLNSDLAEIADSEKYVVGMLERLFEDDLGEVDEEHKLTNQQIILSREELNKSEILQVYCYLWLSNRFKCNGIRGSLSSIVSKISALEAERQREIDLLKQHVLRIQEVREFRNNIDLLKLIGVIAPVGFAIVALIPFDPLLRPLPALWRVFNYKNLTEQVSIPQFGTPMNSALNTIYSGLSKMEKAKKGYYYNPHNDFFNKVGGSQTSEGLASLLLFGMSDPFTDEKDLISGYQLDGAFFQKKLIERLYTYPYAVPGSRKDLFNLFTIQFQVRLQKHLSNSKKNYDLKKRAQFQKLKKSNDFLQYYRAIAPTYSLTDLGEEFAIISQYSPLYIYDLFMKENYRSRSTSSHVNKNPFSAPRSAADKYYINLPTEAFRDSAMAYLKAQAQALSFKSDDANVESANRFFMGIDHEGKYNFLKPNSIKSPNADPNYCQKVYYKTLDNIQTKFQSCGEFKFLYLDAIEYYVDPNAFRLSKSLGKDPVYNSLSNLLGSVDKSNFNANQIRQLFYNAQITASMHVTTVLPRTFDNSEVKKILKKEEVKPFGQLIPETDEVDRTVQEFTDQAAVEIPGLMVRRFSKIAINPNRLGVSEELRFSSVERVYVFFREDI